MKKEYESLLFLVIAAALAFLTYQLGYYNGYKEGNKVGMIKGQVHGHSDVINEVAMGFMMCSNDSPYCRSIYDTYKGLREAHKNEWDTIYPKQ